MFQRSWVRIPAQYTAWTFVVKFVMCVLIRWKQTKKRPGSAHFKSWVLRSYTKNLQWSPNYHINWENLVIYVNKWPSFMEQIPGLVFRSNSLSEYKTCVCARPRPFVKTVFMNQFSLVTKHWDCGPQFDCSFVCVGVCVLRDPKMQTLAFFERLSWKLFMLA